MQLFPVSYLQQYWSTRRGRTVITLTRVSSWKNTSLDRVSQLAVKKHLIFGSHNISVMCTCVITGQNFCYIVTHFSEIFSKKGWCKCEPHSPKQMPLEFFNNGSHIMEQESTRKVDVFVWSGRCLHLWCYPPLRIELLCQLLRALR